MHNTIIGTPINVRTIDHTISSDLASLICGHHFIGEHSPEVKGNRLFALQQLYQAIRQLGDFEHTGDWDWSITVLADNTLDPSAPPIAHGARDIDDDRWVNCDTFRLDITDDQIYNGSAIKDLHLLIDEDHDNDDAPRQPVRIPVKDIRAIYISYDT
jgi:hypothetical protein